MVAPCGFESMTTSPLVSMSGNTGGGDASGAAAAGGGGAGGGAGAGLAAGASLPGAGASPDGAGAAAGGAGAAGGGGGGAAASSLPITSSRSFTWAASGALGSSCRYFSKYCLALSSCLAFSYETATLNRKAGYG